MTSTPVPSLQAPRRRATLQQRVLRGLVRQFGHPRGLPGRVVGGVMAHRSSNRRRNLWAVSLLDVQAADRVLEVGFGPGVAIDELARLAHHGAVYGIDHSDVLIRQATKRNRAAVRAGLVDLRLGSVDDLPAFAEPLDKVLAVNSVGFWPEPWERLKELRGLLRPDGQIAIASQPRCPGATRETSDRAAGEIKALLEEAGFSDTRVETLDLDPPVVCVLGANEERIA
ncbi:MAG: class I SAM-dependent methyltransferase [Actinobacteria bacterium]|nr:MAG: class I SAM-dependent methyltransferase [Actinomycetota bacterium]